MTKQEYLEKRIEILEWLVKKLINEPGSDYDKLLRDYEDEKRYVDGLAPCD